MRKLDDIPLAFTFPVLMWTDGYVYVADQPSHLFIFSRSGARLLSSQQFHLLDSNGRRFDIVDWERIHPFGGVETVFDRLFGRRFQVPMLANEERLNFSEAKNVILASCRSRYEYDREPEAFFEIESQLLQVGSIEEAIRSVRKAIMPV